MASGGIPRRRRVLRHQRLPDHLAAAQRVPQGGARRSRRLLAAPGAASAARGRGADRHRHGRGGVLRLRPDLDAAGAGARLDGLRDQLGPDPQPPVLLPGVRAPVALQAPLVACGRGAVLSALAHRLRLLHDPLRPPPPGDRGDRRRYRLEPADGDPLRPGQPEPGLLRDRHARDPPADRGGARLLLASRAAQAGDGLAGPGPPQRDGGNRALDGRDHVPDRPRLRHLPLPRRLPAALYLDGDADRRPRPPGGVDRPDPREPGDALARAPQLQLLSLALAGARADPARDRRASARPGPVRAPARGDTRARRPLLPLRGAAVPALDQLAAAGLDAHRPGRHRGRRHHGGDRRRLERDRPQGPSGTAARRVGRDHAAGRRSTSSIRSRSPERCPRHRAGAPRSRRVRAGVAGPRRCRCSRWATR